MTKQEYWRHLEEYTAEAVESAFEQFESEDDRRESIDQHLHESAESMVVYYSDAADVMKYTNSPRAIFDDLGPLEFDSPEDFNTRVGCWACLADMHDMIEDLVQGHYDDGWTHDTTMGGAMTQGR